MNVYDSKAYLTDALKTKNYIQIANENSVSTNTIQRKLKKFNLTNPSEKWDLVEIELLKKEYPINPRIYDAFPGRTNSAINHKASRLGVTRHIPIRKYSVNSHFFKIWSTEMAYVLGWFYSDGCVASATNCCSIHLHVKDQYILEKMQRVMDSTHPLDFHANAVQFRVYDYILRESLIKHGCIPRKSLCVDFPFIPKEYLVHFVRGYFDGDGSIYFNKPNTIKVSFCGSKKFINKLQLLIQDVLNIWFHQFHTPGNLYSCICYGDNARKLCRWMYADCKDLYLKRKRERFDNHLKLRGKSY